MMNLQELQTIKTYNYNATIFVMNNNGYASIRATQNNYFDGRLVGTSASSGLEIPNIEKLLIVLDIIILILIQKAIYKLN